MQDKKNEIGETEQLLSQGQTVQRKPQGFSMYPMLVPGRDEVILHQKDGQRLKRGDVVLYRRDTGMLVLHRIVRCEENRYYMVGDNQTEVEGPIGEAQILAVLVAFIRKGKRVSVGNPLYLLYARLWLMLRPYRKHISRPVARLKREWRKIREKITGVSKGL